MNLMVGKRQPPLRRSLLAAVGYGSDIRIIAVINAFGKNKQVKKVFWTLFVAMAGLVLAQFVDPITAQQVVGIITGMGG
jgi:hypothetical protein